MGMDGECLRAVAGGALNFNTVPPAEFSRNLNQLFSGLWTEPALGQCVGAVIGTAALFHEATAEEKATVLRGLDSRPLGKVNVVGDAVTAVAGAAGGAEATLVIAGTGSIAVRQTGRGSVAFAGGLGPLIGGDPGSAFWMVCEAIKDVQRQFVHHGELNVMGRLMCDCFAVSSLFELVSEVHRKPDGQKELAAAAQLLSTSSHPEVVESWCLIEERAGRELARLVEDLFSSSSKVSEDIFVSGSVLLKNERVREAMRLALIRDQKESVRLREPEYDAAMGAGFMALREIGDRTGARKES